MHAIHSCTVSGNRCDSSEKEGIGCGVGRAASMAAVATPWPRAERTAGSISKMKMCPADGDFFFFFIGLNCAFTLWLASGRAWRAC